MALSPDQILANSVETLRTARSGLRDFSGSDPERRLSGFRNAVVFGRAVTNVLEHLRSRVPDFDDWYKPRSAALSQDPGFKELYRLRSQILKEGSGGPSLRVHIKSLNTKDLAPLMHNPPPNAGSFFIGDETGGSGWEILLPTGEKEKFYVSLPATVDISMDHYLASEDAVVLLTRYLDAMGQMITDAREQFGLGGGEPGRSFGVRP